MVQIYTMLISLIPHLFWPSFVMLFSSVPTFLKLVLEARTFPKHIFPK